MAGLLKSPSLLIIMAFVSFKGGEALTTQCYMSDEVAVLGNHSFTLSCEYNKGTHEELRSISLLRKRRHEAFQEIVRISRRSTSLLDDLLKSRTAITSPTPSSSRVSVQFKHIMCTDKGEYKWLMEYSTNGVMLTATATANVVIKAVTTFDESVPPLTVPNSNLEEGDEVTFACEGDVGSVPVGNVTFFLQYKHTDARWISMESKQRSTNHIYQAHTCSYRQTATLKMKLIREMNGMTVRCVVQQDTANEVGDKHRDTKPINVQYPPKNATVFTSTEADHDSDSLALVCTSDSNPAPVYRWFIHHKNTTVDGPMLIIPDITTSDTGKRYTCVVNNTINGRNHEISKEFSLNVPGQPPVSTSPSIDKPAALALLSVLMVTGYAAFI